MKIWDALCMSLGVYRIPADDEHEQTIKAKQAVDDRNKALAKAVELNNKGIAHEKDGELKKAIACYEKNILPEAYVTLHPYTRLTIIYRKAKEYGEELRVIETGLAQIQWAAEKEKLEKRKEKVIELINKNNQ